MTFTSFIEKYYTAHQQVEIVHTLRELRDSHDFGSSLNQFYLATEEGDKNEITSRLVSAGNDFFYIIYRFLVSLQAKEKEEEIVRRLTILTTNFVNDTFRRSGLSFQDYSGLIVQMAEKTLSQYSWNYALVATLLCFEAMKSDNPEAAIIQPEKPVKRHGPVKLEWRGTKQPDLFINDLIATFTGIKPRKNLYLLFESSSNPDFHIELPSRHLLPFLILFYELHESGVLKVNGNRGLFVYLRQHLRAPHPDHYPKRDFRKLKYEAEQNEEIRKEIFRAIQPLLNKYSPVHSRTIAGR